MIEPPNTVRGSFAAGGHAERLVNGQVEIGIAIPGQPDVHVARRGFLQPLQQGGGLLSPAVLSQRLGQEIDLPAACRADVIVLARPAQRQQLIDRRPHAGRILLLLRQVDHHLQRDVAVRDLGGGLVQEGPDAIEMPVHHHRVGHEHELIGIVGPLGQVGGVVQRDLHVGRRAMVVLHGDRQRPVHPGFLVGTIPQVAFEHRLDIAHLASLPQQSHGLGQLAGPFVVGLVEVLPERERVGVRLGLHRHLRGALDRDQLAPVHVNRPRRPGRPDQWGHPGWGGRRLRLDRRPVVGMPVTQ